MRYLLDGNLGKVGEFVFQFVVDIWWRRGTRGWKVWMENVDKFDCC